MRKATDGKEHVAPTSQLFMSSFVVQIRWAEIFAFTLPDCSLPVPWDVPSFLEKYVQQLCLQVLGINWLCLTVAWEVQSTTTGFWTCKGGDISIFGHVKEEWMHCNSCRCFGTAPNRALKLPKKQEREWIILVSPKHKSVSSLNNTVIR